ncbi:FYVE zinc finger-domain-containing protein [Suillus paluster]|uniref:FYVE zinc finger-domain-containing protein n=1 Tax=Suillus paluster TaxID=48578 RepID=UPI001B872361|nr:FYVE zinc finger-domain-containing protein [Suillus paluster]KAG1748924.1 FYVE zinc finger-domain-containing protein [Suillus paluster]
MDSPTQVPYQAYRSKRHSRTVSAIHLVPNVSPPPISRPSSIISTAPSIPAPTFTRSQEYYESEKVLTVSTEYPTVVTDKTRAPSVDIVPSEDLPSSPTAIDSSTNTELPSPASINIALPDPVQASVPEEESVPRTNGKDKEIEVPSSSPASSTMKLPAASPKPSKFRRLRPPTAKSPLLNPSPLRPPAAHSPAPSTSVRHLDALHSPAMHSRVTSVTSVASAISDGGKLPLPVLLRRESAPFPQNIVSPPPRSSSMVSPLPPPKIYSPTPTPASLPLASTSAPVSAPTSTSASPAASTPSLPSTSSAPASSSAHTRTSTPARSAAPYRPGFQPRGLYRPRTDEFTELRNKRTDEGRVERTKLERRLEKLIALHFPVENSAEKGLGAKKDEVSVNGRGRGMEKRRASSFFNLDLKNMDAGELWKGVLQSQMKQGSNGDIRAAEQRITPWQDDAAVSKCPLCTASFHPLTNRKHHCRLCGDIICSLPPKLPQRQSPCSVLFVVDAKTRRIEEVGEGVDYGVRRAGTGDEEKFLRGVRVCRSCRPVLTRQQYWQEMASVPPFVRFYDAFINLEKEIEDALPQFQDLLLTLSNDDQPTKEASAARKRLLDAFAQYDVLAKRIHAIPCNTGSSQHHVQLAVLTRANLFLQKNMFPLQSLPKPKKRDATLSPAAPFEPPLVDPDSDLAHTLQPLLEQEALLESFVGEAMAHRKFEDAKTLKANLAEIRAEIDRMLGDTR